METSQKSSGGYWMLIGLVALLALPMIVDHLIKPAHAVEKSDAK